MVKASTTRQRLGARVVLKHRLNERVVLVRAIDEMCVYTREIPLACSLHTIAGLTGESGVRLEMGANGARARRVHGKGYGRGVTFRACPGNHAATS